MEKGLKHISTTTVTAANTALTMGSGDMEVFATPPWWPSWRMPQ